MKKNIAVLMTVHNRKDATLNCISHFYANQGLDSFDVDFYMVDDGCTDGTPEAVRELFPQVFILKGDGSLYWNGGMHFCWMEASKNKHDFYLWLNDDTILFYNALQILMNDYSNSEDFSIISGCCCDTASRSIVTYGGSNKRRQLIAPSGKVQELFMMNGNCVLIPNCVVERLGVIDPYFMHKAGDNEYGYRAQNNGVKTYVSSSFIGTCDRHDVINKSYNPKVPLQERIKHAYSPLGVRPNELFYLYKKSFGLLVALKKTALIYSQIIFPTITSKILKARVHYKEFNLRHFVIDFFSIAYYRLFSLWPSNYYGYILMYHEISDSQKEDTCHCTITRFREQIESMYSKGYSFVTMDDAYRIIKKNTKRKKFIALTFDDVSDSVYYNAYPILKAYNIPFMVYLATDLIGQNGFLNVAQVKEMIDSGLCQVGSHGVSHKMLSELEIEELRYEIEQSKIQLEKIFDQKINHFAYPYGRFYSVGYKATKIVKQYYMTAVTSIPMKLNSLSRCNTYLISRIVPFFNYKLNLKD